MSERVRVAFGGWPPWQLPSDQRALVSLVCLRLPLAGSGRLDGDRTNPSRQHRRRGVTMQLVTILRPAATNLAFAALAHPCPAPGRIHRIAQRLERVTFSAE